MKLVVNILSFFIVVYVGLILLLHFGQRSLIYLPEKSAPSSGLLAQEGLSLWPSDDTLFGYISTNPISDPAGTVIVFHGNAGAAYHRSYYSGALTKQNLRVILAEYPGYGGRIGRPNEQALVEDALKVVRSAHEHFGGPIFLWGESLGAGVVASVVARTESSIEGVVMFTPWDSLPEVAQGHYPWLPVRWLVKDRFDSIENLSGYTGKVAVVLAGQDRVIPIGHGQRLYNSIETTKKLWVFEGEGHNTIPLHPAMKWWGEVSEFLKATNAKE